MRNESARRLGPWFPAMRDGEAGIFGRVIRLTLAAACAAGTCWSFMRKINAMGPTRRSSPSPTSTAETMRWPLTQVPSLLPVSVTVTRSLTRSIRQCRSAIRSLDGFRWHSGLLPIRKGNCESTTLTPLRRPSATTKLISIEACWIASLLSFKINAGRQAAAGFIRRLGPSQLTRDPMSSSSGEIQRRDDVFARIDRDFRGGIA